MKTIKILATTDLHGFITPFDYMSGKEGTQGLAKLGPIIQKERDANTILVDAGDNLQGTPLMSYHLNHYPEECTPIVQAMNFYRYDYFNIGNHDLNYGQAVLKKHIEEMKSTCITGNFIFDQRVLSPAYRIHEFENGVKIALIGAMTDYVDHWEKPEYLIGYEIQDVFTFIQNAVKEVREKEQVDAVVVIYHGGLERDWNNGEETEDQTGENVGYKICDEIEGIDLLISGHQHRSFVCKIKDTIVTQTRENGKELACIRFDLENKTVEAEIISAGDEFDERLVELVRDIDNETRAWLDTPIGSFKEGDCIVHDQFEARLHKHPLITFLNDVYFWKTHAQLSSHAIFNDVEGLPHDFSMRDVIATCVFPGTITIKEVTGKVLKEYLEKCAEYFDYQEGKICLNKRFYDPKPMHFNYDMVDGINYTIHASYPIGQRVTEITYQGKTVKDEDVFSFAMSNYRAVGGGDFDMVPPCKILGEIQEDIVDVICDYVREKKVIELKHRENVKVIK